MESVSRRSAYALRDYRAHRRTVGDCHALDLSEADYLASQGRRAEAERILHGLVRREPQNPWGHLKLGELLYDGKRWKEAEICFSEAAALVPRSPLVHARRAQALARIGRRALARDSCAAALRLDPRFAPARRTLKNLGRNAGVS
jgi:predicted Zn-dependent protease